MTSGATTLPSRPSNLWLVAIVYAAFIALGLPDTVLGAAWPVMHKDFSVSLGALGILGVTSALSAVASSLLYGWMPWKPPPWIVLVGSVCLLCVAMVGFAIADSWWTAIALSLACGLCGGGIDIQLNNFAATHFSSRHMSWLHGCWGVGAASGPLIIAAALSWTGQWRVGFYVIAAILLVLGLAFWLTRKLWPKSSSQASPAAVPDRSSETKNVIAADPHIVALWLSPVCFFFVVSAEFATAIWIPSIMTDGYGLKPEHASHWATAFFAAMMVGRFLIGAIGEGIDNRRQVRYGIAAAMLGALVFSFFGASTLGAFGVVLMGLGSAPLFPSLMHETTRRFDGHWAPRMVARQMTGAYLAAALMPLFYAALVERVGVHAIIPTALVLQTLLAICAVTLDRVTPSLQRAK